MITDLWELQPRIDEYSRNVGINGSDQVEQYGGILATGVCHIDLAFGGDVELPDLDLRVEDLVIQR